MNPTKDQQRDKARTDRRNEGLRAVADKPAQTISINLGGERAAIVAAIRKGNETPERVIMRLIDAARPKDMDLGQRV